jgi:hypothetical protein
MQINEVINIASKFDAKGFKKAESASKQLANSVKNLAGTFGVAFGAAAVVAYGKASVKVALEAQAEQARLNNILKVTTGASQEQIDILNEQAKALERIGVVTAGNITTTQSQLATFDLQISTIQTLTPAILDYVTAEKGATATAEQFKSATNGLAQALNGNFASLTKTGFVLDDVTKKMIKEGTETERAAALVKVLNSTYKDFNANLRNTDAGKMQVLANVSKDVQTTIGIGIIDSLKILAGSTSISDLALDMQNAADNAAEFLVTVSKIGKTINDAFSGASKDIANFIKATDPFVDLIIEGDPSGFMKNRPKSTGLTYNKNEHMAHKQTVALISKADKLTKSQLAAQKKLLDTQRKIAAEKKKQEILDKAALVLAQGQKVFDEEGIQLAAAAQGKLTEEERLRVALKKDIYDLEAAINQENLSAAARLSNSMVANAQKLAALRTDMVGLNNIENPFTGWLATLQEMAMELSKLAGIKPMAQVGFTPQQQETYNLLSESKSKIERKIQGDLEDRMKALADARARIENKISVDTIGTNATPSSYGMGGSMGGTSVVVNVAGSVSTERDLVAAITQGLYSQQASGTPVTYSTVY